MCCIIKMKKLRAQRRLPCPAFICFALIGPILAGAHFGVIIFSTTHDFKNTTLSKAVPLGKCFGYMHIKLARAGFTCHANNNQMIFHWVGLERERERDFSLPKQKKRKLGKRKMALEIICLIKAQCCAICSFCLVTLNLLRVRYQQIIPL
ncbi:hypothetical protein ACJX0J_032192, partial [Zea mays]